MKGTWSQCLGRCMNPLCDWLLLYTARKSIKIRIYCDTFGDCSQLSVIRYETTISPRSDTSVTHDWTPSRNGTAILFANSCKYTKIYVITLDLRCQTWNLGEVLDMDHSCHNHITSSGVWMQPILACLSNALFNFDWFLYIWCKTINPKKLGLF